MKKYLSLFLLFFFANTCVSFSNEVNSKSASIQPYKTLYLTRNSNKNYFSISAKYPFLTNPNSEPELNYNLYFAYSQKSIWIPSDTSGNDENFLYTNFNPELFYVYDFQNKQHLPLTLQLGFEHESDGLGKIFDKQHHEWDRFYIYPTYSLFNNQLKIGLRIWYASLDLKYNQDIIQYMGSTELKLTTSYLKHFYQPKIELAVRKGNTKKLDHFTFILEHHLDLFNMLPHTHQTPFDFYTQVFYGYGAYLRSYKKQTKSFNFGISYNI